MDRETRQAIRSLQEQIDRLKDYNPIQLASGGEGSASFKLCKITADNDDGSYTIKGWNRTANEGTGWEQTGTLIWEAKDVNFWNGEGVDKYVVAMKNQQGWWITLGWANLQPTV